jgi:hypothetical protein
VKMSITIGKMPDIEKAAVHALKERIEKKLTAIRCADHHQAPRVTSTGTSLATIKWKVTGCCQKLIDKATTALP